MTILVSGIFAGDLKFVITGYLLYFAVNCFYGFGFGTCRVVGFAVENSFNSSNL